MGLLHKLFTGIARKSGKKIGINSEEKVYGSIGESYVYKALKKGLPNAEIKRNVLINYAGSRAETDCLVVYKNKLFTVEIKSWKGDVSETEDGFISVKQGKYGEAYYTEQHKSPFKQMRRASYLLKESTGSKPWINEAVIFPAASSVRAFSEEFFVNTDDLINHIITGGRTSDYKEIKKCFDMCTEADRIYAEYLTEGFRTCVVDADSLPFSWGNMRIKKSDIDYIEVKNNFSYDELNIVLRDGRRFSCKPENMKIRVLDNENIEEYSISKIDRIEIGR